MKRGLPEWAGFFESTAQLKRFEKLVAREFASRGIRVAIEDGRVIPMDPPLSMEYGLTNLGQSCVQVDAAAWPELIARHIDALLAPGGGEALTLEEARERVMLRLFDERDVPSLETVVVREDVPGLRTMLCIDSDASVRSVRLDELEAWGVDSEEMFERAMANVRERVSPQIESLEPECLVRVLSSEDGFYAAVLALDIDRFTNQLGRYGALVSMPTRGLALIAPFNDKSVIRSLQEMVPIAVGAYGDGPGSVSPRVYWYDRAVWHEIPYEIDDDGCRLTPPEELVEALGRVVAD